MSLLHALNTFILPTGTYTDIHEGAAELRRLLAEQGHAAPSSTASTGLHIRATFDDPPEEAKIRAAGISLARCTKYTTGRPWRTYYEAELITLYTKPVDGRCGACTTPLLGSGVCEECGTEVAA